MKPKKILVIKLRALGDTVLMTAPLMELRHAFPEAEIHALADDRWASVLEHLPSLKHVWRFHKPRSQLERAKALTALAFRLRQQHFDCVINLHASQSSALLSRALSAKVRVIHFHGHFDKDLFSTVKIPGKGELKPIIERDMDTLRALGVKVPNGCYPVIFLEPEEIEKAKFLLSTQLKEPVLGVALGASRPAKSWPLERFAELASAWVKQTGGSVLALAGANEVQLLKHFWVICSELLPAALLSQIHIEHTLTVRELTAMIGQVAVLVGNDSGPRHLAVAINTPSVTLFGPESPFEWHPYRDDMHPRFFIEGLSCRQDALPGYPAWCAAEICALTHDNHQCMKKIEVSNVLAECQRVARRSH